MKKLRVSDESNWTANTIDARADGPAQAYRDSSNHWLAKVESWYCIRQIESSLDNVLLQAVLICCPFLDYLANL